MFAALQYLRTERGSVQATLTASGPADAALLASLAVSRAKATEAVAAVLRDRIAAGCAGDPAQRAAFGASIERLIAVRHDTDAAMQQPLAGRAVGLAATWAAASTEVVTRLDHLSAALTEKVRLVDAPIAELMAVKQLGWQMRDNAGLERNFYSAGINTKTLPVAAQTQMAAYRGRIEGDWDLLRELTARPGAPARVRAAMQGGLTCLLLWEPYQPVHPITRLVDGYDRSRTPGGCGSVGNCSNRSGVHSLLADLDLDRCIETRLGQHLSRVGLGLIVDRHGEQPLL